MTGEILAAPAKLTLSLRITGLRPDGYHLLEAEMVTLGPGGPPGRRGGRRTGRRGRRRGDHRGPRGVPGSSARARGRRQPGGSGAGPRRAPCPGDAPQVDPGGRGTGRRLRGRGGDPALGGLRGRAPRRAAGRRCGVLPAGRPGAGRRHRGDHPAPAVRTAHLHALHPALRLLHGRRVRGLGRTRGPAGAAGNDLEAAALAVEPRLAGIRDALAEATGQRPRLAGSGSTWFVEGAYPAPGRRVVQTTPSPPVA